MTDIDRKVLISERHLYSIADEIRDKVGTDAAYTPEQMATAIYEMETGPVASKSVTANGVYVAENDDLYGYSSVTVNVPSGSGGGGSALRYQAGKFFGTHLANPLTSLECAFNTGIAIGARVLLVVMHRDTITLDDAGFSLVTTITNTRVTSGTPNTVSIYEKIATTKNFTVTITPASETRMCACYFVMDSLYTISSTYERQEMDANASTYQYTISPRSYPYLLVMSNGWASTDSNVTSTIYPLRAILPQNVYNVGARTGSSRLAAYMSSGDISETIIAASVNAGSDDRMGNELYIFPVVSVS